jgi:RHS repeat-associated protein
LYGSARLGEYSIPKRKENGEISDIDEIGGGSENPNKNKASAAFSPFGGQMGLERLRGYTHYELTNHLGNVLAVVTDRKLISTAAFYVADVLTLTDYYAFGQAITERTYNAAAYKYGYNGKEKDPETGLQDYGFRMYDPRLCRFPSVDPLTKEYPYYSPYQFAGNMPIQCTDIDGAEPNPATGDLNYNFQFNNTGVGPGGEAPANLGNAQLSQIITDFRNNINNTWGSRTVIPFGWQTSIANSTFSNIPMAANPNFQTIQVNLLQGNGTAYRSGTTINLFVGSWNQRQGTFPTNDPAHEFGHNMGLTDRYIDGGNVTNGGTQGARNVLPLQDPITVDPNYNYRNNLYSTGNALTPYQLNIVFASAQEPSWNRTGRNLNGQEIRHSSRGPRFFDSYNLQQNSFMQGQNNPVQDPNTNRRGGQNQVQNGASLFLRNGTLINPAGVGMRNAGSWFGTQVTTAFSL